MLEQLPYELVTVPGMDDLKILVVKGSTSQYWDNPSGSKAPWWLIKIVTGGKDLLESNLTNYPTCAELFGFHIGSSRTTGVDIGNQLFTSAMIRLEDCIVVIPNGGYVADLENKMYKGTHLDVIDLKCMGWFEGQQKVYQQITLKKAYIISITHDLDRVFIRFRVLYKQHVFSPYTQEGKPNGQAICIVNLSDNTVVDTGTSKGNETYNVK